jgi:small subunit ribosomal protein S10
MYLYLKIYSFHHSFINKFIKNIELLLNKNNLQYNIYNLPIKNDKYTILRSPHVNKSARDQFQKTTYKKQIKIKLSKNINLEKIKQLITLVKLISTGIKIKINFKK